MRRSNFGPESLAQNSPTAKCRLAQTLGRAFDKLQPTTSDERKAASRLARSASQVVDLARSKNTNFRSRQIVAPGNRHRYEFGAARQPPSNRKQLQVRLLRCQHRIHASLWLALRAGVLRRAVSRPARPILCNAILSVSVGRSSCSTAASLTNQALRQRKWKHASH